MGEAKYLVLIRFRGNPNTDSENDTIPPLMQRHIWNKSVQKLILDRQGKIWSTQGNHSREVSIGFL